MNREYPVSIIGYLLLIIFILCSSVMYGQDPLLSEEILALMEEEQDSLAPKFKAGNVFLPDPAVLRESYSYDPKTERYYYEKNLDGSSVAFPLVLTRPEYEDLMLRSEIRKYFQLRFNAMHNRLDDEEAKKDLLPRYYVNSKLFEGIFGSNTIDVKPTGSVEFDVGVRISKQDNPVLSSRSRKNMMFDFDQRISMGLQGMVGTRLAVNMNYDTQATFDFQNMMKLSFEPDEDDIVKKIEVGNVSMPLNGSLIRGAQSLFGVLAQLQFGRTTVTGVFSEQKSQTTSVRADGGGMMSEFELFALDYDDNRHFFLSQYFRNNYDESLKNYPYIDSRVHITRVDVWVTNRYSQVSTTNNNTRSLVSIVDLGEGRNKLGRDDHEVVASNSLNGFFVNVQPNAYPSNTNNRYDPSKIGQAGYYLNNSIRTSSSGASGFNNGPQEGSEFTYLESARKLSSSEFVFHPRLGYISLNQRLSDDEVLAVAYEYTVGDKVYRVGEFGYEAGGALPVDQEHTSQGGDTTMRTQNLIVKLLKSSLISTGSPSWRLMMKNIYQIPNASYLSKESFRLNIMYTDPSPLNVIQGVGGKALPADVDGAPLLRVFHLDRLNYNNDPQKGGDGFFDFISNGNVQEVYDPNNPYSNSGTSNGYGSGNTNSYPGSYGGSYGGNSGYNNGGLNTIGGQNNTSGNYPNSGNYGGGQFGSNGNYGQNTFDGITIDAIHGRVIFTSVEPFGEYLFNKLKTTYSEDYSNEASYNPNQKKYVFRSLYTTTKTSALRSQGEKNKFQLKGKYSSQMGEGIPIGSFNVAPGSVVVRAGGRVLAEGLDYTVDYNRGRVMILDQSLVASNTPIDVSVENNTMFGQQTKRFFGFNVEHKVSKDFIVGGSYLRLSERPMTHKSMYGQEAVNNTIWGFNAQYSTEVPFFTRLVNKLPNIDTDVESRLSVRGEFAYLQPGSSKNDQMDGEATSYVDDFEGTQSKIDIKNPLAWKLSSVPIGFYKLTSGDNERDVPPLVNAKGDLEDGFRRAKLSWYTIDPVFYVGSRPEGVTEFDMTDNRTRRIFSEELFPEKNIAYGESRVINTLDLTYYPKERGSYNYNPIFKSNRPQVDSEKQWGGIMRSFSVTNFEQANIEYLEFWMLDPFESNVGGVNKENKGNLRLNLGMISEDILRDGYKQYENGLPTSALDENVIYTSWGKVPSASSLIYAFDTNAETRARQDVGLDGLNDEEERLLFGDFGKDPSADNFVHYLDAEVGGILARYKNYNGTDGNSPAGGGRSGSNQPDAEDVDGDNTMNTIDAYYEYSVDIKANLSLNDKYVTDIRTVEDGKGRWIQFKIPISSGDFKGRKGVLEDMHSMRFMRMYLTGFKEDITLRLGSLDLIRSDWRKSDRDLREDGNRYQEEVKSNIVFEVNSVNIQENGVDALSQESEKFGKIPYVSPPGVRREQFYQNETLINANEQSLALLVYPGSFQASGGLEPKDARGAFKAFNVDMRQYKRLKMFVHAHSLFDYAALKDDEVYAYLRLGNDVVDNYYEVRLPLKITSLGSKLPEQIWPKENEFDIPLDLLSRVKVEYMSKRQQGAGQDVEESRFISFRELGVDSDAEVAIIGNPNYANVRMMMIGVRNMNPFSPIAGEFWFDELRLAEMDNKGGWAATATVDMNFADFATISATGMRTTAGFGGLEQGPQQRSKEDYKSYSLVTNVNLGHLLPRKWGIVLPMNYAVSEEIITPEYDPLNPDLKLDVVKSYAATSAEAEAAEKRAMDYTKRKSINFIGVTKHKNPEKPKRIYDVENLSVSHSYNEIKHHDFEVEGMLEQQVRTSVDYGYSFTTKSIEPLSKVGFLQNKYFQLLRDFNFNLVPANISFSGNVIRQYHRQKFRTMDVEGLDLDPLYRRNYNFNYNYGFNLDLTRALRLTYIGGSNNIVRNYYDVTQGTIDNSNTIWDDYFDIGTPNQFTQQLNMTYELPIHKIPFLSFVRSNYNYTGTFNWQRASDSYAQIPLDGDFYNLGNTIQNSRTQMLNTTFSFEGLYTYLGLGKRNNRPQSSARKAAIVPGQKVAVDKRNNKNKVGSSSGESVWWATTKGILTSIKTVQVNYSENSGTMLPGFLPDVGFFGTSKPSLGFVFGDQSDIRYEAARKGYLTDFPNIAQPYTRVSNRTLNITASIRPLNDLLIEVSANRMHSENFSEQFSIVDEEYQTMSPYSYGNFSMSTMLLRTAFGSSSLSNSAAFERMRDNRIIVAQRLALENGLDPMNVDSDGFPIGYSKNSQSVLLPSFLAAYSGESASKVSTGLFRDLPLPNWTIRYSGLMRLDWFKKNFRRFSINHGYRASYTIGSYTSNYDFSSAQQSVNEQLSTSTDVAPEYLVSNVTLYEQFNPLIRFDVETSSAVRIMAEIRKDRMLSLSFDNNLLTETQGHEYVLGFGYRIKDVGFVSSYANNGMGGRISSDVNIKADLTMSKRETVVRDLNLMSSQVGGGQNMWSLRIAADYMLSNNLTTIFFYEHSFSKALISTMYPVTNIRAGFTVRYNFGN